MDKIDRKLLLEVGIDKHLVPVGSKCLLSIMLDKINELVNKISKLEDRTNSLEERLGVYYVRKKKKED